MVPQEHKVLREEEQPAQVLQGHKETQELKVFKVLQEEPKVLQDSKVLQVHKVLREPKVYKVL
jgi:hypothetical protein